MIILGIACTLLMAFYAGYLFRAAYYFDRLPTTTEQGYLGSGDQEGASPTEKTFPFISIVVPARNEEAHIANCLNGLLAQDYPADRVQIILVNDQFPNPNPPYP